MTLEKKKLTPADFKKDLLVLAKKYDLSVHAVTGNWDSQVTFRKKLAPGISKCDMCGEEDEEEDEIKAVPVSLLGNHALLSLHAKCYSLMVSREKERLLGMC